MIETRHSPLQSVLSSILPKRGKNILARAASSRVVDDAQIEIHRESVDSAEKSG